MKFVIAGAPRTKKNSQRILRRGKGRFIAPSVAYEQWELMAVAQLRRQYRDGANVITGVDRKRGIITQGGPLMGPLQMNAQVFRERAGRADLLNYLAAVSDALEAAGVVEDDKLIVSVDGSRMHVDRKHPRVEIELTPATEAT